LIGGVLDESAIHPSQRGTFFTRQKSASPAFGPSFRFDEDESEMVGVDC
jgi:hypothetical protein